MRSFISILILSYAALAQTQLSTTSLSSAVSANPQIQNFVSLVSTSGITVNPQTVLYVDKEAMFVSQINGITKQVIVLRGQLGTSADAHISGSTVYFGRPNQFFTRDPSGGCDSTSILVTPWINVLNGNQWTCNGSWLLSNAAQGGLSDPGANGIVTRTGPNVTSVASSIDVLATFSGTCNSSTYARGDGACQTPPSGGSASFAPIQKASASGSGDTGITGAIAALPGGNGTVWADYSTNQTWASCPTWGSGNVNLILYAVTFSMPASGCTIPANVALIPYFGALLSCSTNNLLTINGVVRADIQQLFTNCNPGQGAVDFTGNFSIPKYYPEWWGCTYNSGTAGCNGGLQAAIYAAYGCNPSPATLCRTNSTALPKYNRVLWFSNLYAVNVELKVYHMIGFRWEGESNGTLGSGIQTTNSSNLRILDMQSVAYGTFSHLAFVNAGGANTNALVDDDYNAAQGIDLRPQNTTFEHINCVGNNLTDVCILIAKSGGGSQGDNIRSLYNYYSGFTGAGLQIGGNGTGRNVGRSYAQNALKIFIVGGDVQGCPLYGFASYGGSYEVQTVTFENNTAGGIVGASNSQTGVDMYCESPQGAPCKASNIRSESLRLAAGGPWTITDSTITANWAPTFDNVAGNSEPLNQLITGTWVHGDGKYYKITVSGTFGGLPLTTPTSASATTLVNSGAAYTVNAFVGSIASIMLGTDSGCYGAITSNDATTITFSAGLTSDYNLLSGITCTATPDTSSKFVVEPNWGTQTTSGGATFALFDFNAIDGPFNNGTVGGQFQLKNVDVLGGKINATGTFEDISVTRTDWMPAGNQLLETQLVYYSFKNVIVQRTGIPSFRYMVPWNFVRNGVTGYKDYSQFQVGTLPICWAAGQLSSGIATSDICVRPDPNGAGNKNGRFQIVNGSSGTQQFTNFNADGSTTFPSVTFLALPASGNGSVIFCSDCNSTCTAGSSTGRTCFRENGAWTH